MAERKVIDARGSFCPGPLMELIGGMKLAQVGDELEVLSNDKGSANDIPEWINKVGHQMIETRQEGDVWHIAVRKMK
jgi:tRNA 2-thiouridine synthesizing protein A